MGLFNGEFYKLSSSEQAELFFNSLTDFEKAILYGDWITHIWLYENEPPNTREAVEKFGFLSLFEEFKKAFIKGDFKRMKTSLGTGNTFDEGVFLNQIETRMLHVCVLSDIDIIQQKKPELAFHKIIPHVLLMSSYPLFIKMKTSDFPHKGIWKFPTLLVDGDLNHTIHVQGLSDDRQFIIYDEYWWKGHSGISFFSKGENSQDTSAELIDPLFNTFKTSQSDFWKFFVGFIMPRSGLRKLAYAVWQMKAALEYHYPEIGPYNPLDLINHEPLITLAKSEFGYL